MVNLNSPQLDSQVFQHVDSPFRVLIRKLGPMLFLGGKTCKQLLGGKAMPMNLLPSNFEAENGDQQHRRAGYRWHRFHTFPGFQVPQSISPVSRDASCPSNRCLFELSPTGPSSLSPTRPSSLSPAGPSSDKLATMMNSSQPQANVFFQPDNLGALPYLWLQAKLTISLTSIQDKFARLFMSIAAELWLRDAIETVEEVFTHAARNFTLL